MENIAKIFNGKQDRDVLFISLDMVFVYGQTLVHPETATLRRQTERFDFFKK